MSISLETILRPLIEVGITGFLTKDCSLSIRKGLITQSAETIVLPSLFTISKVRIGDMTCVVRIEARISEQIKQPVIEFIIFGHICMINIALIALLTKSSTNTVGLNNIASKTIQQFSSFVCRNLASFSRILDHIKNLNQSSDSLTRSKLILTLVVLVVLIVALGSPVEVLGIEGSGNLRQHIVSKLLGLVNGIEVLVSFLESLNSLLNLSIGSIGIVIDCLSSIDSLLQTSSILLVESRNKLVGLIDRILQQRSHTLILQTEVCERHPVATRSIHLLHTYADATIGNGNVNRIVVLAIKESSCSILKIVANSIALISICLSCQRTHSIVSIDIATNAIITTVETVHMKRVLTVGHASNVLIEIE